MRQFLQHSLVVTALVLGTAAAEATKPMVDVCVIPGLVVLPTTTSRREPADTALALAGRAMLVGVDGQRFALLELPGCRVRELKLGSSILGFASSYTVPSGRTLYRGESWNLAGPEKPARRIDPPAQLLAGRHPVLANDGLAIAWLVRDPAVPPKFIYGRGTYVVPRVLVHSLITGKDSFIPLPTGTLANELDAPLPRLLAFDGEKKELTLAVEDVEPGTSKYLAVDLEGSLRWGPITTDGVPKGASESENFRRLGAGWVAWGDSLNADNAPLQLVWSLKSGSGSHRVKTPLAPAQHPKIDGAAVSPDGEYIAVGVGLHTRMLLSKGRTYVLRVRDGKMVFDHQMFGANGGSVAFLGNDHFCYSDYDEKQQVHATHVVQLPK